MDRLRISFFSSWPSRPSYQAALLEQCTDRSFGNAKCPSNSILCQTIIEIEPTNSFQELISGDNLRPVGLDESPFLACAGLHMVCPDTLSGSGLKRHPQNRSLENGAEGEIRTHECNSTLVGLTSQGPKKLVFKTSALIRAWLPRRGYL